MQKDKCSHTWEMVNIAGGLIVMKKCFHCSKVSTCFVFHNKPPLEECHEEKHFWNFMESDETFHFDLKCTRCGILERFDEMVGLMICTGCDPKCEVDAVRRELEGEGVKVCIAMGQRPVDERRQLAEAKIDVLQKFFDQQDKLLRFKIKVVPHTMVRNIESCYAEAVKAADVLFAPAMGESDKR